MNLLGLVQEPSKTFQNTFQKWFLSSGVHPSLSSPVQGCYFLPFIQGLSGKKLITYPPDNGNSFLDYLDNNQAGLLITTDQP